MSSEVQKIPFADLLGQYQRLKEGIDRRMRMVLEHGHYIMGPEVAELEQRLAAYAGVRHCIGVADGTTALLVALMALEIKPGDEVITTPFTFVATAEMISLVGATPVFVDIDPLTYNIDPSLIEAAVTSRTKAIMPVSLYGQCADMDPINEIAARHGLSVIEDAAQSFGALYKGRRSCGLSTIACTSFFPSKPLGCYGDGGACFTNDDELAGRMASIRLHGQTRRYHHSMFGLNGRLDTLQAAVLLAKLDAFDEELQMRSAAAERYDAMLSRIGVKPPVVAERRASVYGQYTIRVRDRKGLVDHLAGKGIPTAVHYPTPLHKQPIYMPTHGHLSFPHSETAANEVLSLPFHAYLTPEVQGRVVDALAGYLAP